MTEIQKDILRTLAFYDVFEIPMTGEEIHLVTCNSKLVTRNPSPVSLVEIQKTLSAMLLEGALEREEVFYCLKGRRAIVKQRKMRYPESLRKLLKSQKWIRLLHKLPFVRNIYFAGSVAMQNARVESDIDLVIVSKQGRVWSSRFFVNSVLAVLSMRVHGRHWVGRNLLAYGLRLFGYDGGTVDQTRGTNTLCTAFFIDESVEPKTVLPDDRQFQFWVERWMPIQVESMPRTSPIHLEVARGRKVHKVKRLFEMIVSIIPERVFRWGQEKVLMPRQLRERAKAGNGDVVLGDSVIKLHLVDRRREYEDAYLDRLQTLGIDPAPFVASTEEHR